MRESVRRFKLRERASGAALLTGLEGLNPDLLAQFKAMIAQGQRAPAAAAAASTRQAAGAPIRRGAAGAQGGRPPKAIIPLDHDERGFGEF